MDIDSGTAVGPFGHHAGKQRDILAIKKMSDALDGDRFEPGISQNDLFETPCRWVTCVGGLDICLE